MKQYQTDFPLTENKEVFSFTSSVSTHKVLTGIWNPLLSGQIVNSIGQGIESVHLTVSLGISKTITLTTISQQAHAC